MAFVNPVERNSKHKKISPENRGYLKIMIY
jgi:hypothetical protein